MNLIRSCFGFAKRRNSLRSVRGSVAVEAALIFPAFLLLLMGTIEFCLIFGAQALMESAAYRVSRLGKTGYVGAGLTQAETVTQLMVSQLSSFGSLIDTGKLVTSQTVYNNFANIGNAGLAGYGEAQDVVVYTISYPWKIITPVNGILQYMGGAKIGNENGVLNLNARIVVRNEPYH